MNNPKRFFAELCSQDASLCHIVAQESPDVKHIGSTDQSSIILKLIVIQQDVGS